MRGKAAIVAAVLGILLASRVWSATLEVEMIGLGPEKVYQGQTFLPVAALRFRAIGSGALVKVSIKSIKLRLIGDIPPDQVIGMAFYYDANEDGRFDRSVDVPLQFRPSLRGPQDGDYLDNPNDPDRLQYLWGVWELRNPPNRDVGDFMGNAAAGIPPGYIVLDGFNTNYDGSYRVDSSGQIREETDDVPLPVLSSDPLMKNRMITVEEGEWRTFFIVLFLDPDAEPGRTIGVAIEDPTWIQLHKPVGTLTDEVSPRGFPFRTRLSTVRGDIVEVGGASTTPGNVLVGQLGVPMLRLDIGVNYGTAVLREIIVEDRGTSPGNDVERIRLYRDDDGDGRFDPSKDTTLLAEKSDPFAATNRTSLMLSPPYTLQAGQPLSVFVVYDIKAGAVKGDKLAPVVSEALNISVDDPDEVYLPRPIEAAETSIWEALMFASVASVAPEAAFQAQKAVPVAKLTLEVPAGSPDYVILNRVTLRKSPTSTCKDEDIGYVYLYADGDGVPDFDSDGDGVPDTDLLGDGVFDKSVDQVLAQAPLVDGKATFDLTTISEALRRVYPGPDNARNFFIAADIVKDANTGVSFGLGLYEKGGGEAEVEAVTAAGATVSCLPKGGLPFPLVVRDVPIANVVVAEMENLIPEKPKNTLPPGAKHVPIARLILRANPDAGAEHPERVATLRALRVDKVGSSTRDYDVERVLVYWDRDADDNPSENWPNWEPDDDDLLVGQGAVSGGKVILEGLSVKIPQTSTGAQLIIAFDVSSHAATNVTLGALVHNDTYIKVAGPDLMLPRNFPLRSGETWIGDVLDVTGQSIAPPVAAPDQDNVALLRTVFQARTGAVKLLKVVVEDRGEGAAPEDLEWVGLYEDVNKNGALDPEDELVASTSTINSPSPPERPYPWAELDVSGREIKVFSGKPRQFLVALNIAKGATVGHKVALAIADVQVQYPDLALFPAGDVVSEQALIGGTVRTVGTSLLPAGLYKGQKDVLAERLTFEATVADAKVSWIELERIGDGADADVEWVRMALDDGDGNYEGDPTDPWITPQRAFVNGRVRFDFSPEVTVPKDGRVNLFVVLAVRDTAGEGNTLGLRLASTADFGVDPQHVKDSTGFPVESSLATIGDGIEIKNDQANPAGLSELYQGQKEAPLMSLTLQPKTGSGMLRRLKFDWTGGGLPSAAVLIRLYKEKPEPGADPKLGELSPSDTLIGEARPVGGQVVFDNLNRVILVNDPLHLLVTASLADDCPTGADVRVGLTLPEDGIVLDAPDLLLPPTSPWELTFGPEVVKGDVLTVSSLDLPEPLTKIEQGQVAATQRLKFEVNHGTAVVRTLKVTLEGTASITDVEKVLLYEDADLDPSEGFRPEEDKLLAESAFGPDRKAVFEGVGLKVEKGSPRALFIVLQMAEGAAVGGTLKTAVSDADVEVAPPDQVEGPFSLESAEASIEGNTVKIAATDLAPERAALGGEFDFLELDLSVSEGSARVTGIDLSRTGSAAGPVVAKVVDKESGQVLGSAPLGTGLTQIPINLPVGKGEPKQLLVRLSVSESMAEPTPGSNLGVKVEDVGVAQPDQRDPNFSPVESGRALLGDQLRLVAQSLVVANSNPPVAQGAKAAPLAKFYLEARTYSATVSKIDVSLTGTAVGPSAQGARKDVDALRLYLDDGDGELDPEKDQPVGTPIWAEDGKSVKFTDLNLTVSQGEPKTLFLAADIAPGAVPGATLGVEIEPDDIKVEEPDILAPEGLPLETAKYVITGQALVVEKIAGAPQFVKQGQEGVVALTIGLSAVGMDVKVEKLAVEEVGPAKAADVIERVRLRKAGEEGEATGSFDPTTETAEISLPADWRTISAGTTSRFEVLLDIKGDAPLGAQVNLRLEADSFVGAGGKVQGVPVESGTMTVGAPVGINGAPLDPDIPQGPHKEAVWSLALSSPATDVVLSSLRLTRVGDATDSDVPSVELWVDKNGDGTWGKDEDTLAGRAEFKGGVALLSGLNVPIPEGGSVTLFVVVETGAEAIVGRQFELRIASPGDIGLSPAYAFPAASFPRRSDLYTIVGNKVTVTLDTNVSPPPEVEQGEAGVALARLVFEVDTGEATLSGLEVHLAGTARDADLSALRLYLDRPPLGEFNPNVDLPLTERARPMGGKVEFTGLRLSMSELDTAAKPKRRAVFVVADIAPNAEPGRTLAVRLPEARCVVLKGEDIVDPSTFPLESAGTKIVASAETVSVGGESIAPSRAWVGQRGVPLLLVRLSVPSGSATLTEVAVHLSGKAEDVAKVYLYADTNGNGKFDLGTDALLGQATFGADGIAKITGISRPIRAGRVEELFVVADISDRAAAGDTISVSVGPGDVVVAEPDSVGAFSPIVSAPLTLGHGLDVQGASLAPASAKQGESNVPLLRLDLEAATGSVEVEGLSLVRTGTATTTDIRSVKVAEDRNGNGKFDEGDETLASGRFDSEGRASLDFVLPVSPSSPATLFVLVDVEPEAAGGRTFGVSIPSAEAVKVAEPSVVKPGAFPISSGESFIAVGEDKLVVTGESIAPDKLSQGEEADFLEATLVAGPREVRISSITVHRTGSAEDDDVRDVYLKVEGRGGWSEPVWASFTGGVAVFDGLNITVGANRSRKIRIGIKASALAIPGRTVGVQIAAPDSVEVATGNPVDPSTFPVRSAEATLAGEPDTVTVQGKDVAPSYATPGQEGVRLLQLDLSLPEGGVARVEGATFKASTPNPGDVVSRLALQIDEDMDGVPDRVAATTSFAADGTATFSGLRLPMDASQGEAKLRLILTADIRPDAPLKTSLKLALDSLALRQPDGAQISGTVETKEVRIFRLLYISARSVAPGRAEQGQEGVALLRLTLTPSSGEATVAGISYAVEPADDVENPRLVEDENGNGLLDPSDEEISAPFTTGAEKPVTLFIVADVRPTATAGHKIVGRVENVTVSEDDVAVQEGVLPVESEGCEVVGNTLSVRPLAVLPDGSPVPPSAVAPSKANVPFARLVLRPSAGFVKVTGLSVELAEGDVSDVAAVAAYYAPGGEGGFEPLPERRLDRKAPSADGTVNLNFELMVSEPTTLYVACDISPEAELGHRISLRITGIEVEEPDEVRATLPIQTGRTGVGPLVSVSGASLAPPAAEPGKLNVPFLSLLVSAEHGPAKLVALKVRRIGEEGEDADISGVKLFLDNGDGKFDPYADTQITGSHMLSGGVARLEVRREARARPGSPLRLFLVADISDSAKGGHRIGFEIEEASWVEASYAEDESIPALVSTAGFPIQSGLVTVGDGLVVSGTTLAPQRMGKQVGAEAAFLKLELSATSGAVTVKSLKVHRLGTALPSAVYKLTLRRDDGDGKFDPEKDALVAQKVKDGGTVFDGGIAELSGFSVKVEAGKPVVLYLALVLDPGAAHVGRTIGVALRSPEDVGLADATEADRVMPQNFPIESHLATIGNAASMSGVSVAPKYIASGERKVALLSLTFTTPSDRSVLMALTVHKAEEATLSDAEVEALYLYRDKDENGRFDPEVDELVSDAVNFSAGVAKFEGLDVPFGSAKPLKVFVVADISPRAQPGKVLAVQVRSAECELQDPDVVDGSPTVVTSNAAEVKASVVRVKSALAGRTVYVAPGQKEVVLLDLAINLDPAGIGDYTKRVSVLLSRLSVRLTGSLPAEHLSELKLYADMPDEEGKFDGKLDPLSDSLLATAKVEGDRVTFDGLNISIGPVNEAEGLTPRHFYVVGDVLASAPIGSTLTLRLDDPGFLSVEEPNSVWLEATPLQGPEIEVYPQAKVTLPKGYSMVSVPLEPTEKDAAKIFGTNKVARWNAARSEYDIYPEGEAKEVEVGKAYTLLLDAEREVSVAGTPLRTDAEFSAHLLPGWNEVGNPFPFEVALSDLKVSYGGRLLTFAEAASQGIIAGYAWTLWGDGNYELVHPTFFGARRNLEPWHGYWFYAEKECDLVVPPTPATGEATRGEPLKVRAFRLIAKCGADVDGDNLLALAERARAVGLAILSPPPVARRKVDLQLVRNSAERCPFGYAVLAASLRGGKAEWLARVVTDGSGEPVTLTWPDLREMPRDLALYLLDLAAGRKVNMRTAGSYTFKPAPGERERLVKVEAVKLGLSGGRLRVRLVGAGGSLRGAGLAVTLELSREAALTASVRTASGRTVRVLFADRPFGPGIHTVLWDGRDSAGRRVPAGIYLLEVVGRTAEGDVFKARWPLPVR